MDQLNELLKYDIIDIAWASGLIEGEGCFQITKQSQLTITVGSVDFDIIQRLYHIFKMGHITHRTLMSSKELYVWKVTKNKHVKEVLHLILPFMGKRRSSKIDELLTFK